MLNSKQRQDTSGHVLSPFTQHKLRTQRGKQREDEVMKAIGTARGPVLTRQVSSVSSGSTAQRTAEPSQARLGPSSPTPGLMKTLPFCPPVAGVSSKPQQVISKTYLANLCSNCLPVSPAFRSDRQTASCSAKVCGNLSVWIWANSS